MRNSIFPGLVFGLLISFYAYTQNDLVTTAESSDFKSTSTFEDVKSFVGKLSLTTPYMRVETLATTVEGKDLPLLIIANPMPKSPDDLINDPRVVVYIQANIHAGEVEGKEASLMMARDLLAQPDHPVFRNVVLLICPILNADGNDRISKDNRTNQVGPVHGVGVRYNGQFLDLNRDAVKMESPEIRGVIARVFNRWDPAITVDCHTTNGSYHEEAVTFTWMMNPNGDRMLINYMRDIMMPAVHKNLYENHATANIFYGEFIDRLDYDKGWISYATEPRYLVNYVGVRNRLGILNENYVYADFKTRVQGCYNLLWSILEYASQNASGIKTLIGQVDRHMTERFRTASPVDSFAITYEGIPTPEKITIRAIEADTIPGVKGYWRYKQSDRKRTVTVPYIADYIPRKNVVLPFAYIITVPEPEVTGNLVSHGIQVRKLTENTVLNVEGFKIKEIKPSGRLNQGHYTNSVEGEFVQEQKEFTAGSLVVFTAQKLGNLASCLLEPQSDDGLLFWNFFDRYLVPQWGDGYFPYPVYKLNSVCDLKTTGL